MTDLTHSDPQVRIEAILHEARMGNVVALLPMLDDEDLDVRQAAVKALSATRDIRAVEPLVEALRIGPSSIKMEVVHALINMREPGLRALIDVVVAEDLDVRYRVLRELGFNELRHAVSLLISLLEDENPQVRELAATRLSQADSNAAVLPLIAALKDEYAGVRLAAVTALGRLNDIAAVNPLLRLLDDPSPRVRQNAAMVLGIMGDTRALPSLIKHLLGQDGAMRKYAALAIGGMGETAVEPLVGVLAHGDEEVRALAITLLGEIRDPAAVPSLIDMLDDEARPRRRPLSEIAAEALEKIGTPEAQAAIKAWRHERDADQ